MCKCCSKPLLYWCCRTNFTLLGGGKGWLNFLRDIQICNNKKHIWDKLFKNGPSKICGRRPLKILKQTISLQIVKGCLPQIITLSILDCFVPYITKLVIYGIAIYYICRCFKHSRLTEIVHSYFYLFQIFNVKQQGYHFWRMLINQFVSPIFFLCFSFTGINSRGMLHHVCDVAYEKSMWGPIRSRKCKGTNWLINYMFEVKIINKPSYLSYVDSL